MRSSWRLGKVLPLIVGGLLSAASWAQCPQLFDGNGNPSSAPSWISCSGLPFNLSIGSPGTIGAFTIDWGDGTPVFNGTSLTPPQLVSHVYAVAVAEYTVTFTVTATGCVVSGTVIMEQSTSASIQIPVGGLTQVCAPQAVDFINSATNTSPNTVFKWNFGDGTGWTTYDATNLGQTLSHMYMPGTVGCQTMVQLSAENACNTLQGGPSIATFNPIRIWDIDSAHITPSATLLCWPDNQVVFTNTTDRNCLLQGNIYQRYEYWNFGNYWGAGQDSTINWNPWPPTFPHTLEFPAIGSYTVTLLDSNYCGIDTTTVTINIVPPPAVTLTATPTPLCAGFPVHLDQSTAGGANHFEWNYDDGTGFHNTGGGDQDHTYTGAGSYNVQFTASIQGATAGCTDTATAMVTVLPSPTAQFALDQDAACVSLTTTPTNQSVNASTYLWDFGDGNTTTQADPAAHTYATPGVYTITLTAYNSQGCFDVVTQDVHVYSLPEPLIGLNAVCDGIPADFTDLTVTESGNPITSWSWDFGDGATDTAQAPTHLYASSGTYAVTLTTTTPYCSNSSTDNITVQSLPVATFTADPDSGCSPTLVNFTNTSTGAGNQIWYFGDGATSNAVSPTHSYTNYGTTDSVYTATLVAGTVAGCSDTARMEIQVAPPVLAGFTNDAVPGCAPLDVQFTNMSTGADTYLWDFGDGTTSTDTGPSHIFVNLTSVLQVTTVTLTATSWAGCSSVTHQSITIYPTPQLSFSTFADSGCAPVNITFPSVLGAVSYIWTFGDGGAGSGPSPTHTYLNNTDSVVLYPVKLIATNAFGCMDSATTSVTVFPMPSVQFNLSQVTGCHPLTATLDNTSQGASAFHWSYGDGTTSDSSATAHAHTWYNYAGPGITTYPVMLTGTTDHGCSANASGQVQVYPAVTASMAADSMGCSPFHPHFVNLSTGATGYFWSFGDGGGSILPAPPHAYMNQGLTDTVFHPMLVATSAFGCADTATTSVTVHPAPIAQFTASPSTGCPPLPVSFQDLTIGASLMDWQFGDAGFQDGPPGDVSHTYINTTPGPVAYNVRLIASSPYGCTDTATGTINVYPTVLAQFDLPTEACSPAIVDLVDGSTGAVQTLWDMGDGVTLVGSNVTHTYTNTGTMDVQYTVTVTATSAYGCISTAQHTITVHPTPGAAFLATPFQQMWPGDTIDIANNTAPGPWTFAWNYGDGNSSTEEDPGQHIFGTWGTYTVQLTVSNGACSDTASQQVTIDPPLPSVGFAGSGEGCAPLTVSFTNTSLLALGYLWDFGDGGTSGASSPTYTYYTPGTYSVSLTAFGTGGGTATLVKVDSVVVHPSATAYFTLQPAEVVAPTQPLFTYNLSGNATSFVWDFGDGTFSNGTNPVHYYQDAGNFDVTLIANNAWNCPDTFSAPGAVTAIATGTMTFPNAFTPSNSGPGDGIYQPGSYDNNIFHPMSSGVEEYHLQIFNRWGELLFETNDIHQGWDGYYRGQAAKQDVYVWKAHAKFSSGEEKTQTGDVTLLR
jgi:gliding motility-associated-like protein